jgi:predicted dinucleotide-binding enzyme
MTDTKISIIGTGDMGAAVARLAARSGPEVYLSNSRGPASLAEMAAALGSNAHACSVDAARAADIAVIAIPFDKYRCSPRERSRDAS